MLLWELAVGAHPLPGYPAGYYAGARVEYDAGDDACVVPAATVAAMRDGGYPDGFIELVRLMVACDPSKRPSLTTAASQLQRLFDSETASLARALVSAVLCCAVLGLS